MVGIAGSSYDAFWVACCLGYWPFGTSPCMTPSLLELVMAGMVFAHLSRRSMLKVCIVSLVTK